MERGGEAKAIDRHREYADDPLTIIRDKCHL